MFISLVTGAAQVRAGKLRGYGVTSAQRSRHFLICQQSAR